MAMTTSTVSKLSRPRSFVKCDEGEIYSPVNTTLPKPPPKHSYYLRSVLNLHPNVSSIPQTTPMSHIKSIPYQSSSTSPQSYPSPHPAPGPKTKRTSSQRRCQRREKTARAIAGRGRVGRLAAGGRRRCAGRCGRRLAPDTASIGGGLCGTL